MPGIRRPRRRNTKMEWTALTTFSHDDGCGRNAAPGRLSEILARAGTAIAGLSLALCAGAAQAQDSQAQADRFDGKPFWELVIGPFAVHFSNESEHKHVYLLGIERNVPGAPAWSYADATIWGFSAFNNSFGQPSAYAYYGFRWDNLFGHPKWYAKISGGVIYGYKGEYEDKVPFNHDGFGLGIIPAIGYRVTPNDAVQIGTLGTAGLIFTYNRRF